MDKLWIKLLKIITILLFITELLNLCNIISLDLHIYYLNIAIAAMLVSIYYYIVIIEKLRRLKEREEKTKIVKDGSW